VSRGVVVALADVARIVGGGKLGLSGKDFVEDGFPAYGAGGVNGMVSVAEHRRSGVVLSSIGARCGKCFYADGSWTSLANTQVILPDPARVDARFLWYQLNDEARWPRSGTGQPFIKPSDVKAHQVWVPSMAEQGRIAAILDQADRLQGLRRAVLAGFRELRRSLFRSLFDADSRSRWSSVALSDALAEGLRNGVSPSSDGTVAGHVLTLSAVTRGRFDGTAVKDASFSVPVPADQCVQAGLVLICRGNGNRSLVGRAVISARDMPGVAYPDTVIAGRLSTEVEPQYFLEEWDAPEVRRQIEAVARTTNGTFKVNQKTIGAVRLRLPPLALQREFGQRVEAVMRHEETAVHQLDGLRDLFASLQDRAFKGEL